VFHAKVNRPWGSYTVLEEDQEGFKIKRIEVAPGARLSLQSHRKRSEHWVVVSGTATVTTVMKWSQCKKIRALHPIGTKHRLENQAASRCISLDTGRRYLVKMISSVMKTTTADSLQTQII